MKNSEALAQLKDISTNLEEIEYGQVVDLMRNSVKRIPIPVAKLVNNAAIDRARKNNGEILFSDISDITYISDQKVIQQLLTEFGRANCPHQSMFYGAIETSQIQHQRITAIAETSTLYQDPEGINLDGELYTISRWRSLVELEIAEMVFSEDAIVANPDIEKAFNKQVGFAKRKGVDAAFYKEFLIFISSEFARKKESHHDYKISSAYTNLTLNHPKISGISYPSVQTGYKGENIVFPPNIVDQHLRLEAIITQRLFKNRERAFINNHMECLNPHVSLNNFMWTQTNPVHIAPRQEIDEALIEN